MTSAEQFSTDKAIQGYLPLMHELGNRIELVAAICEGKANLARPSVREFAYLQFRYMCELIALGCLQLHGYLAQAQTPSAKKEWHAEKIMRLLHNSYPHSFPQSLTRLETPRGWELAANSKPHALTREEFKTLYVECGEVLHAGTIRSLEAARPLEESDYQRILEWQRKIVDLMNEHFVGRANNSGFYVISLRTTSGYPECTFFTSNSSGGLDAQIRKMTIGKS